MVNRAGLLTAIAATAALLVLPAAASAGSVSLDGNRLEISAGAGKNELLIRSVDGQIRIEEFNPENGLRARGGGCTAPSGEGARVECPAAGIREIQVSTRGGNDWVVAGNFMPDYRGDRNQCIGSDLGATLAVRLGAGRDIAELGKEADIVRGGRDHDLLMGCDGDDLVVGGEKGDDVSGDDGDDDVRGGGGADTVVGCRYDPDDVNYPRDEPGDDNLRGGEGNDFLYGCDGDDTFAAGSGDDALNSYDGVAEVLGCGEGNDLVYADEQDSRPGCEVTTYCTTDNFPIGPETGIPECFVYPGPFARTALRDGTPSLIPA